MSLTEKTTHAAEALAKLIFQFKDDPGLQGLLNSYMAQVQEIEAVLFSVLEILTDIDSQVGAQLDLIGSIVGQAREGRSDADYLKWIKARMVINTASGLPDEFFKVLGIVVPGNAITYAEHYPAGFMITLADALGFDVDQVVALLAETRAAGVGGWLEYTLTADAGTFTFASGDTVEASAVQGFSGDQMLANPLFSAWTADNPDGWSVTSETASNYITEVPGTGLPGSQAMRLVQVAGGGFNVQIGQTPILTAGETYKLTIVVRSFSGTDVLTVYDANNEDVVDTLSAAGTHEWEFVATGGDFEFYLYRTGSGSIDAVIESITLVQYPYGGDWADVEEI